jgi:hypothetical protein
MFTHFPNLNSQGVGLVATVAIVLFLVWLFAWPLHERVTPGDD